MTKDKFILFYLLIFLSLAGCKTTQKSTEPFKNNKNLFFSIDKYYAILDTGVDPMDKAARLIKDKHYQEAHTALNTMLKKKINSEGVYYYKGYIYLLEKKYDLAKFMYKKVKSREEYIPAINNNLGVIAILEGEKDEAYFLFSKVLKTYEYYFPALVNRGFLYLESGLFERAQEDLEIATLISPNDYEVSMAFGVALRGAGFFDDAEKIFTKLSVDPNGLYNLGLLYYEDKQDWKKAINAFDKYLSLGVPRKRGDMARNYLKKAKEKLSE